MPEFFDRIPERYSVLLIGPSGSSKYEFCLDFIKYCIGKNQKVIFMATDTSPEKIRDRLKARGIEMGRLSDRIILIDCYAAWASVSRQEGEGYAMDSMPDAKSLKLSIDKAVARLKQSPCIIVDSMSSVFLYNFKAATIDLIQHLTKKGNGEKGTILFTVHEGVHDTATVNEMRSIVDCVVEMKLDDSRKNYIRITPAKEREVNSEWEPFNVTDSGLKFGEKAE